VLAALFSLNPDVALITASRQLWPFFIGGVLVEAMFEVLFAVVAALFAGIITQTSKGTLMGIFASVGLFGNGIGNAIVQSFDSVITPTYVTSLQQLCSCNICICLYHVQCFH